MRWPLTALFVVAWPAAAAADPPARSGTSARPAPSGGAASQPEADSEHPPLGKAAVEAEARRDAVRASEAERAEADRVARKAALEKERLAKKAAESNLPDKLVERESSYKGVELEGKNPPPGARHLVHGKGPAQLTWVGFRVEEGVPMVFAQLSRPVVWSVDEKPEALVYTLQSAGVPLSNNRRPLDVSAFGTHIKSVVAARAGRDVTLTVRTHGKPTHRERHQDAPGGYKFLVIELPAP